MTQRFLGYGAQSIDAQDIDAVVRVLKSPFLTQGPAVEKFEAALSERVNAKYAVAVSSGTAALHLACLAAGMGQGDVGVTSSLTFVASANAFVYSGGRALLSDVDSETYCMSAKTVREALQRAGSEPKVITPVHFAGLSADVKGIRGEVGPDVAIVEDACHAIGGQDADGQPVGSCAHSDMTVFSFHPVKTMTTGEGGAVTTNNPELYDLLVRLRNHGIERDPGQWLDTSHGMDEGETPNPWYYEQQMLGYNYRMTDIQAALGLSQLSKLDAFIARRRGIAAYYDQALSDMPHVIALQSAPDMRRHSGMHLYALRIDFSSVGKSRSQVMAQLKERGIGTQVHYIPVHRQPYHCKAEQWRAEDFPVCENYYGEALSIPLFPAMTDEDAERVCAALNDVLK